MHFARAAQVGADLEEKTSKNACTSTSNAQKFTNIHKFTKKKKVNKIHQKNLQTLKEFDQTITKIHQKFKKIVKNLFEKIKRFGKIYQNFKTFGQNILKIHSTKVPNSFGQGAAVGRAEYRPSSPPAVTSPTLLHKFSDSSSLPNRITADFTVSKRAKAQSGGLKASCPAGRGEWRTGQKKRKKDGRLYLAEGVLTIFSSPRS